MSCPAFKYRIFVEKVEVQEMPTQNEQQKKSLETRKAEVASTETIFIGSKPLMRYVMASMSVFLDGDPERLRIAARGRAISRAVDTAEVLRHRYLKGFIDVEDVHIGTDEVERREGDGTDRVSSINIFLKKVRQLPTQQE